MSNLFNKPDNLVDMVRQIISGESLEEKKKEEELDPVGREDDDVDNDGDVDASDKYLKKRRKAISKALNEKEPKKKINDVMKEETLDEAEHEDGDGEKMTDAQKKDMDGDGEKEKKKKKKKDGEEDEGEAKPDKVDTEPEKDDVKTMMSEREMTDKEKAKLDKMKKKYEGGEMHKAIKAKYGDKADEVFYGKLTKMAMGEKVDMNEAKDELEKISKELAGASKTHKGQSDRVKKLADKMDEAKDEERDTNLVMQLRKAISLRGNKVTFADGKSVVVSDKDAQKFMGMFSKLKKPAEKEMLMKSAAKSHEHFKMALAGKVEKPKSSGLDLPKMKSEK